MARSSFFLLFAACCCVVWDANVPLGMSVELKEGEAPQWAQTQATHSEAHKAQRHSRPPQVLEYIVPQQVFQGGFRRFNASPTHGEKIRIVDQSGKMRLEPSASADDFTLDRVFPVEGHLCNLEKTVSLNALFQRYTQKERKFWKEKTLHGHKVYEMTLPVFDPRKCSPQVHEPAVEFCVLFTPGLPDMLEKAKRLGFAPTALPDSLLVRILWTAV
ncbi:hypothetical protein TGPRC2_242740 [Toxoplasma gondii TgCatPRC2]|uniref:Uncharacterized protein n=14 Tax=Toxoplasma gondii TaxID=5811 RepID=B9PPB5_TOXGV|nr:hypothetical protein TGME49_242740 [Toxoplasma gondii ME49]EPR60628.1 hypothetical protein TGGT1_242740 [Toxoplasma gondii GT1]ESS31561.1 hypothetical protein TGVEG_242740 [Toxoplasma gondii VEG]KAF4643281.1 hypothetical protein TGRH88_029480 [Toxoplasma gondii]KFG29019.1 hypothetical protein TGP89_242740 [Toxoplasma gondii p89]KFG32870.1 hypothetical protein TGDOM2_242740 [Toxoplasma gondii GAB2-2007-GAL-DOM2]KFG51261.1 hypothetical protein TGFOU_242740 [Toxoplasma gondii FOU]KFG60169.1 |eukprot:XP_002366794.1 hypothetical protein TGME49_242740 [Toxoplasma gondii ME49]